MGTSCMTQCVAQQTLSEYGCGLSGSFVQSEQVMAVEEIIPDGPLCEAHRNYHNDGSLGDDF